MISFQQIEVKRSVQYACAGCGKKRQKSISVTHTINPFNVNESGQMKNAAEVRQGALDELGLRETQFLRHPLCTKCEPSSYAERKALCELRTATPVVIDGGKE